ncbi:hypothetical protein KC352_g6195 [Hortaea werneckii]|nr:hypothetical protein KC352_g6195 [Hortaea werneckii]
MSETFSLEVEEAKDVIVRRQPLDLDLNRSNGSEDRGVQQVAIPRPVHGPAKIIAGHVDGCFLDQTGGWSCQEDELGIQNVVSQIRGRVAQANYFSNA